MECNVVLWFPASVDESLDPFVVPPIFETKSSWRRELISE